MQFTGKRHIVVYITHQHQKSHCYVDCIRIHFLCLSCMMVHVHWIVYTLVLAYVLKVVALCTFAHIMNALKYILFIWMVSWLFFCTVSMAKRTHYLNKNECMDSCVGLFLLLLLLSLSLCLSVSHFFFLSMISSSFTTVFLPLDRMYRFYHICHFHMR